MSKYHVYLADNWNRTEPFTVDWDYELIGDKFRAEFDVYFAEQEKLANAGGGKTKQLFKGEYVKKFMILKRINLVDDPSNGNLKSVFVLRQGEKKLIDGRARQSLASRFEYQERKDREGNVLDPLGFLKFDTIEAEKSESEKKAETFQVEGNDIEYFEEETQPLEPKIEEIEKVSKEKFVCEECGKEFANGRALNAHILSHKK